MRLWRMIGYETHSTVQRFDHTQYVSVVAPLLRVTAVDRRHGNVVSNDGWRRCRDLFGF